MDQGYIEKTPYINSNCDKRNNNRLENILKCNVTMIP